MAQNSDEFVIWIKNDTQGANSPIANSTKNSESKFTAGQQRAQIAVKGLVALDKYVVPFVEQAIQHTVSTIELRTGASELQQRVEFGLGIAKSVGGIATSFLTGYAIGNLPGAIIGTLISSATTIMNYVNKAKTIDLQASLENISLQGLNVRAGGYAPSYGASRTRNQ